MKIDIKIKGTTTFREAKIGTVFQLFHPNLLNDYYMKIGDLDDDTAAIYISTGLLYDVKDEWVVVLVKDASLTVEI